MSNDNVALVRDFLAAIDGAVTDKDPEVIERHRAHRGAPDRGS